MIRQWWHASQAERRHCEGGARHKASNDGAEFTGAQRPMAGGKKKGPPSFIRDFTHTRLHTQSFTRDRELPRYPRFSAQRSAFPTPFLPEFFLLIRCLIALPRPARQSHLASVHIDAEECIIRWSALAPPDNSSHLLSSAAALPRPTFLPDPCDRDEESGYLPRAFLHRLAVSQRSCESLFLFCVGPAFARANDSCHKVDR